MTFNTIHANDFHFYEEVNDIVQYEPNEAYRSGNAGTSSPPSASKRASPSRPTRG